MSITLTQAQAALSAWVAADLAVAKGQSYSMNGRSLTLANVREITINKEEPYVSDRKAGFAVYCHEPSPEGSDAQ